VAVGTQNLLTTNRPSIAGRAGTIPSIQKAYAMRNAVIAVQLVAAFAFAPRHLSAQDAPDHAPRTAAARDLLKASGTVDAMISTIRANLPLQKEAMPQIPEEFWVRFEKRMEKDAPQLGDSIAVIYARTFSLKELQELNTFYRSAVGRRLVAVQPHLIAEGAAVGQRWGARVGEEIANELME
jgi:hypothetical protein